MYKNNRHLKILEIIEAKPIETQGELAFALKSAGFDVTQATVSRDIKRLGLVKVQGAGSAGQRYALESRKNSFASRFAEILNGSVLEIKEGNEVLLIRVAEGCGRLVKQALSGVLDKDKCYFLADEDTVAVFLLDQQKSASIIKRIKEFL